MASSADSALRQFVATALAKTAPAAAKALSDAIMARHSEVAAVLFYGSCLRRKTAEGVLDFYVVVDSYRGALGGRALPLAAALLPPTVFYLECDAPRSPEAPSPPDRQRPQRLRCKYAVISVHDFEHLTSRRARHCYIWARFAQPSLLVYVRDTSTREQIERCAAEALVTCLRRLVVFLPARAGVQRFSLAAFWQQALGRTYASEVRTEKPDTVRGVYQADSATFDRRAELALDVLAERGITRRLTHHASAAEIEMSAARRWRGRLRWWAHRPLAKALAVARLLKTAVTFGDWLPYAVWKIERHNGTRIELSERQRRHPLLFAWPVLARLLASRSLR